MKNILGLIACGFAIFFVIKNNRITDKPIKNNPITNNPIVNTNCNIKGNISINSGRKIYHVPGQKDYENTRIQTEHGERWFCSEEEAINAGWKKAPR